MLISKKPQTVRVSAGATPKLPADPDRAQVDSVGTTLSGPDQENPIKNFIKERPIRAAYTAFTLGVAVPAALGFEFGLGFQGIGNVVSVAAIGAYVVGSGEFALAVTGDRSESGMMLRRGLGDITAGVGAAFVSPGGTPLAAAAIAVGATMAAL